MHALSLPPLASFRSLLLACALAVTSVISPASVAMAQQPQADIVDTAVAAGSFTTLATALQAAGLVDTLKGDGPFTVFAPTDEAFAKLPPGTLEALLADPAKLQAVLTYHVVPGRVTAADVANLVVGHDGPGRADRNRHQHGRPRERCPCDPGRRHGEQRRDPRRRHRAAATRDLSSAHEGGWGGLATRPERWTWSARPPS